MKGSHWLLLILSLILEVLLKLLADLSGILA